VTRSSGGGGGATASLRGHDDDSLRRDSLAFGNIVCSMLPFGVSTLDGGF